LTSEPQPGSETPLEVGGEPPPGERWFVPFVVIPLGLAGAIVGIVVLVNFMLGQTGPRTLDELLTEIQSGGANARKQAAFHLARNVAEQVDANNKRLASAGKSPVNTQNAAIPRRELVKIERAYDAAKGDPETREFLINALGYVGDDETAEFLGKHLTAPDEPDEGLKRHLWLVISLGRIGSARSVPVLDAELARVKAGELDTGVASALAAAYGNLATPDGTRGLRALLAIAKGSAAESGPAPGAGNSPPSPWKFVRWTVAVNLAKRRKLDADAAKEAAPWLIEALDDIAADPMRPAAERVFKAAPGGTFAVAGGVDKTREQAAAQVLESVVALEEAAAIPAVRRIAKGDPNLRIRSFALDALSRLESKSAPGEPPR
jgi:hypothetical protein